MCDITNEITMRLDLGQRALEDSRGWVIRGSIMGKVPSDSRCLGPKTESIALSSLSHFCLPAKLLSDHVLIFQQLCFVSPRRSVRPGAVCSPGITDRDGQQGIHGGHWAFCQPEHHHQEQLCQLPCSSRNQPSPTNLSTGHSCPWPIKDRMGAWDLSYQLQGREGWFSAICAEINPFLL